MEPYLNFADRLVFSKTDILHLLSRQYTLINWQIFRNFLSYFDFLLTKNHLL